MKSYEQEVMKHYSDVAAADGDSKLSTMKDGYVREKETKAIIKVIQAFVSETHCKQISVLDVGCGNGYTLSILKRKFNGFEYIGLEKNDDLRKIALERFRGDDVRIVCGDICQPIQEQIKISPSIIISQRVVINLLDREDQKKAIHGMIEALQPDGILVLLESFEEPLVNLNLARKEFELPPIHPSYHNLYLNESILEKFSDISRWDNGMIPSRNFLSSHYYISRVLHDVALNGKPFARNSQFVNFFSQAFSEDIGEYSPLQLLVYKKSSRNVEL